MESHRSKPGCNQCHGVIDPIGLALENFDAIGRWRVRTESGTPVDAAGGLPDGSTFTGMSGLREALVRRPELFVGTLTEKLMTYGLGRGLEFYDAPAVRKVVRSAKSNDYRFSSLVLGIVNSEPFQMRVTPRSPRRRRFRAVLSFAAWAPRWRSRCSTRWCPRSQHRRAPWRARCGGWATSTYRWA
jgi:hypothetical protein